MRTILSLRRHQYLKRVGIFLIAIALIVGIVSCNGGEKYDLTMAVAPASSGTATDETGGSPYARNDVVDIKAVPDPCYRFVDWSTTAGAITNTTAAETTFTMPAEAVTVTANFELTPLDHYKFYTVEGEAAPVDKAVQLVDQFGTFNATVGYALSFGNAVKKTPLDGDPTEIEDPDRHFTLYDLEYEEEPQSWRVTVKNQFGDNQELTVQGPFYLAVPTQKGDHPEPECLDHFLVYDVIPSSPWLEEPIAVVDLHDQFQDQPEAEVWDPVYFATPVQKTYKGEVTEVVNEDEHMVFYYIDGAPFEKTVQIVNQFGEQTLDLIYRDTLAVPSEKISWEQPLDHFKCYWADWTEGLPPPGFPVEDVQLKDQFVTINATVHAPYLFANPVDKWVDEGVGTPISNWNNHLTFYWLEYEEYPQWWQVTVDNQFGPDQELEVGGPFWLAVPTTKADHGEPVGLDHFLVYQVLKYAGEYPEVPLFLEDQFTADMVGMYEPAYFACPVQKTIVDSGKVTERENPDEHLVFYGITGGEFLEPALPVNNQFGEQLLYVYQDYKEGDILGVPSQKTYWKWGGYMEL